MQPYHEGLGPKLQKELQDLRDQGLFKKERILVSPQGAETVSYTHLTLPTNREV